MAHPIIYGGTAINLNAILGGENEQPIVVTPESTQAQPKQIRAIRMLSFAYTLHVDVALWVPRVIFFIEYQPMKMRSGLRLSKISSVVTDTQPIGRFVLSRFVISE